MNQLVRVCSLFCVFTSSKRGFLYLQALCNCGSLCACHMHVAFCCIEISTSHSGCSCMLQASFCTDVQQQQRFLFLIFTKIVSCLDLMIDVFVYVISRKHSTNPTSRVHVVKQRQCGRVSNTVGKLRVTGDPKCIGIGQMVYGNLRHGRLFGIVA